MIPDVPPGETFDICLRTRTGDQLDDARAALAVASLWLACAYGGIGARTRRGFGGLRITAADGALPAPWTAQNVLSPGLGHYEQISRLWPAGPVGRSVRHLGPLAERYGARIRLAQWDAPAYPVLSRTRTLARVSGGEAFQSWADVTEYAGKQLRRFRTRASRSTQGPGRVTPREALYGNSNRFPEAVLGPRRVPRRGRGQCLPGQARAAALPLRIVAAPGRRGRPVAAAVLRLLRPVPPGAEPSGSAPARRRAPAQGAHGHRRRHRHLRHRVDHRPSQQRDVRLTR